MRQYNPNAHIKPGEYAEAAARGMSVATADRLRVEAGQESLFFDPFREPAYSPEPSRDHKHSTYWTRDGKA